MPEYKIAAPTAQVIYRQFLISVVPRYTTKSADKISNRADDDAPSDESYLLIEIFGKNSSWRKYYLYDELPKQKSSLLWVPYEGVYKVSEHNRDILYEMARE
ncbi:MAG: hypothetical protein LBS10_00150 [Gracilibacteraceae bacterium]|nr:hypothetical protein [Gracilibacteraceae bacterium]